MFYALARPELMDLLEVAQVLLEATGHKVDLCSVHGSQARRATAVRANSLIAAWVLDGMGATPA